MGVTRAALALTLAAGAATAQTAPWGLDYVAPDGDAAPLYDAPGGSRTDALREGPVEALVKNGWLRVSRGERSLWLDPADVAPAPPATLAGGALPDGLACFGTEPFWSLTLGSTGMVVSMLGAKSVAVRLAELDAAAPGVAAARFTGVQAGRVEITRADCSDGMSEALHPWRATLTLEVGDAPPRLTGCCRYRPTPGARP
jgi:uncharacterized membrane protein